MKLFCNKLRQIYASRRQDRPGHWQGHGQPNKQKRKRNGTKRNVTKPTNKQTMKRKRNEANSPSAKSEQSFVPQSAAWGESPASFKVEANWW
ncbi:uncharacterized protein [Drosophila pseudoobscura]|uniref:Uncharacterized protein n=1 Tax=Drosophila pseudoobscura pseudoobscura TaxID=46245 RepID=A0A6I8VZ51_DROPS|nr:uncharacterized protein LOC26533295 [Drosophila pseudoobscura]